MIQELRTLYILSIAIQQTEMSISMQSTYGERTVVHIVRSNETPHAENMHVQTQKRLLRVSQQLSVQL